MMNEDREDLTLGGPVAHRIPVAAGHSSTLRTSPDGACLDVVAARGADELPFDAPPRRRGTTLVEVVVTAVLLGTVFVVAVPTIGWVGYARRAAERRVQATLEVENIMERLTARDWDEITNDAAAAVELSDAVRAQLPGANLECTVEENAESPAEKRVSVRLSWSDRAGHTVAPVRLVAWVYRRGETER